jgi:O-antigen/teichoic acid export membrane protein
MSKKLITNSIYYTLGKMLPMAVSFIMVPIYTTYLLPYDYGIVNSMKVLISVFTVTFSLSIETSLFRLYYDYKEENKKRIFLGTAFLLIIISTTIGSGLLFLFSDYIEKIYREIDFAPFYILAILSMYFGIFAIVPRIIFVIAEKGRIYFLVGILQLTIALILNIIYIIILDEKAVGVLKALLLTNLIMLPVYLFFQLKYSKLTFNIDIAKNIFKFSLPLLPAALSGWIMNSSSRIFLDQYFSQTEVGIFSLGFRITFVYIMLITSIRLAYNPLYFRLASSDDQNTASKNLFIYNNYFFIISVIGCLLFLNEKYFKAWIILSILTYSSLFLESSSIFRMSLYQKKVTGVVTIIVIIIALINLILNWFLISKWGIYGAGAATLICSVLLFFSFYLASKKHGYFIGVNRILLGSLVVLSIITNLFFWMIPLTLLTSLIIKIGVIVVILSGIYFKYQQDINNYVVKLFKN